MKKMYSLIKACMTNDMHLFKIKTKKKTKLLPIFLAIYLMFYIGTSAYFQFEKLEPFNLQSILLSFYVFGIALVTIIEGIYKIGPILFNCKDDDLLLSLPIKRRTVLFIRIFKFYIFELLFNTFLLLPIMISYIFFIKSLNWTYFLTSFIMLIFLPIIPIIISCLIGAFTTSISSKFKYKNLVQIVLSMSLVLVIMYISFNVKNLFSYFTEYAKNINDIIIKIYYPAGVYGKLITNFNILDLLTFILVNILLFAITLFILNKIYFKINSRLKKVVASKKVDVKDLKIKSNYKIISLIKKELKTLFNTPVYIINSSFSLLLYIIISVIILFKFDSVITLLTSTTGIKIPIDFILNNKSIIILILISMTSYMASMTNSLISLEGRGINILKSLPLNAITILMSKIYTCLLFTTPVLFIGDILLFLKFKTNIIECILLLILSILIPLVSHFIGILVNLKYPKLDAENSTEIVKQSMSSFLAVMIGIVLFIITTAITIALIKIINIKVLLILYIVLYLIIDYILYMVLIKKGAKEYNSLSI